MPLFLKRRAAARRQNARSLSAPDGRDTGVSVDLSQAGTRSAGRNLYRRVAAAARAVRAGMAAVTGWTWQAISRGPLGNMLSIVLALGIGGGALYGGIAGRGTGHGAEKVRSHARDGIPRTEQASATAVLPSAIGARSPAPPLTSDREAYALALPGACHLSG